MSNETEFDFNALPITITYAGDRSKDKDWPHDEWLIEIAGWTTTYNTGLGHRREKYYMASTGDGHAIKRRHLGGPHPVKPSNKDVTRNKLAEMRTALKDY